MVAGVAVAFQANDLPNPLVECSTARRPGLVVWKMHTLNPKFVKEDGNQYAYDKLPSDAIMTFKLFDNKGTGPGPRRRVLLGDNNLCCSHLTGEDPVYVWLPLHQPGRHRRRARMLSQPGQVPDLQASHSS